MSACGNDSAFSESQFKALSYIFLGTSCGSFIGATSIVAAACAARKFRSPEVMPLFHLSLADMLTSLFVIASCILFLVYRPERDAGSFPLVCSVTVGFVNTFCFSTFILTLAYAIEVYRRIRDRFAGHVLEIESSVLCHRLLYAAAWLIPLVIGIGGIIVVNTLMVENVEGLVVEPRNNSDLAIGDLCLPIFHDTNDSCLQGSTYQNPTLIYAGKYVLLIPLLIVLIGLAVVYLMVVHKFRYATVSRGILGPQQRLEERSIRRRATCYIVVFCICWIPSIVLGILSLTPNFRSTDYFPLYVVQASTATLQGFLNSVVYGWSRKGFKEEIVSSRRQTISPSPFQGSREDQPLLYESDV